MVRTKRPAMHIAEITSRQGNKSYRTTLVRSSYRDPNGKVQKKTLANLSKLPPSVIALVRAGLDGRQLTDVNDAFDLVEVRQHGAVEAVTGAFRQLGFDALISSQASSSRNLVLAMIAARIIRPHTKFATCRWWRDTTLMERYELDDVKVDDLYAAMDL